MPHKRNAALSNHIKKSLSQDGYFLFRSVLQSSQCDLLIARLQKLWLEEGDAAGQENYLEPDIRRLANLADKGEIFRPIFGHPLILSAVAYVCGPEFHLSMLNARDVPPGMHKRMIYHQDVDGGVKADENGYLSCTAIWMLDPFTAENGATRLVPGSHLTNRHVSEVMDDRYAAHPDEIALVGNPGDVLVFNGHCWHAGAGNHTDSPRQAILAHYLRADVPLSEDRRQHLSPESTKNLNEFERKLLAL